MKHEKGQGTNVETVNGNTTTAAPVQAAPTEAIRDLKAEQADRDNEADKAAAAPILRTFETNVQATAKVQEASDGRAVIKEVSAKLTEHVDAAIAALEGAGLEGPRLARLMIAEFAPILEKAGWASAKDLIGRRCTKFGHRQRAPKEGEAERQAIAAKVKEQVQALKAMNAGTVADQAERFRVYWNASTAEQKAAIRAIVNADVLELATV